MTERTIKALSASRQLQDYRILHFATHGLVAGNLKGVEPALMFTPPESPSEEDDGLLTASEAAQLELDADWVVMSACNTAAGDAEDAEALAGLTRAFFHAGARSLLVSHWAVNSDAAVEITTGAFTAMKADAKIGRAEALRRSLKALIAKGGVAAIRRSGRLSCWWAMGRAEGGRSGPRLHHLPGSDHAPWLARQIRLRMPA